MDDLIDVRKGYLLEEGLPDGVIITDSNIYKIYFNLLNGRKVIVIPAGEVSKSIKSYEAVLNSLDGGENKIVAFGGGVVGDLAGFVASTYKRGVDFVQVPTTLLSMVDSSIGGKNGINFGNKKNLIGTFYLPKKIIIDPSLLTTLPEIEFKNGVAEIIKYSCVFGEPSLSSLDNLFEKSSDDLLKIIKKCIKLKNDVVKKDLRDKNVRHVLNFGHTIGHALELKNNLSHGEAISIGMVLESKLGVKKGIFSEEKRKLLIKTLEMNGLPTSLLFKDLDFALNLIRQDKKGAFVCSFNKENYSILFTEKEFLEVLKNG